ncbi:MAG: 3'(2'),5'-bisphosphate nucleotidase CysQ family protein [Thainema sp.]
MPPLSIFSSRLNVLALVSPEFIRLESQIRQLMMDCGSQARKQSMREFDVFTKSAGDYVTTVDRLLDQKLAQGLALLFPNDGIVTEENALSRQIFRDGAHRLWAVDPIDGTADFIEQRSHYAVMAGLLDGYLPIAGWVYAPALEQFYCGGTDWGIFQASRADLQLQPLRSTPPSPPDQDCTIVIGYRDRQQFGAAIADQIPNVQFSTIGSFGLKVMEVVQGRAGLYVYLSQKVKIWDTVAPLAIAQAAGLICCDLVGNAIAFDPSCIDLDSLTHQQPILVGWPDYIYRFRFRLQQAVIASLRADK